MSVRDNDLLIVEILKEGRLKVDRDTGFVYAPHSNTPNKPLGALTSKGYLRTCINFKGRQVYVMLHRVVWIAVNGIPCEGYEIDHKNGKKSDNHPDNLEAVPGSVNMERAKLKGLCAGNGRKDGIRDNKGRFGKKAAGRLLDGREWNEYPEVSP